MAACSSDGDNFIEDVGPTVKKVTLNTEVIMASETNPIMQRKATCDFPALYEHTVPSTFNVYFIPTDIVSATITYTNVEAGKRVFELPAMKYRVVVTNSEVQHRYQLPQSSDVLLLFGENTVDFTTIENVDVEVTNDYASIMVAKNKAITSAPIFGSITLADFGSYYNIYMRNGEGGAIIGDLGINNWTYRSSVSVMPNEVHRFMICAEDGLNIIVDSNILTAVTSTIIDRNKA
jgi:hypothetical protein